MARGTICRIHFLFWHQDVASCGFHLLFHAKQNTQMIHSFKNLNQSLFLKRLFKSWLCPTSKDSIPCNQGINMLSLKDKIASFIFISNLFFPGLIPLFVDCFIVTMVAYKSLLYQQYQVTLSKTNLIKLVSYMKYLSRESSVCISNIKFNSLT